MLKVHHLGVSQSDRIVWLCEELGIDYELVRHDRDPASGMAPADYKKLSPFGTAPVIEDGDLVLGESGAIIDYIIARYGKGRLTVGAESPGFTDYLFWFHFAQGSFMPAVMVDIYASMTGNAGENDPTRLLRQRTDLAWDMTEQRLGEAPYFAGQDFTAADIVMLFPLTTARLFAKRDLDSYPNIRAYLQKIADRPAYQRAIAKADPDLPPVTG